MLIFSHGVWACPTLDGAYNCNDGRQLQISIGYPRCMGCAPVAFVVMDGDKMLVPLNGERLPNESLERDGFTNSYTTGSCSMRSVRVAFEMTPEMTKRHKAEAVMGRATYTKLPKNKLHYVLRMKDADGSYPVVQDVKCKRVE
jgi:hypothetical protein